MDYSNPRSPLVRYQQTAIVPSSPHHKAIAPNQISKQRSPFHRSTTKRSPPIKNQQKSDRPFISPQNKAIAPTKYQISDRPFIALPQSDRPNQVSTNSDRRHPLKKSFTQID
ncbi:hypothetical protein [Pseudanabaena sp. 'Roaring Creek']|uniref:hypothetical protein n=1 Tax=Pseudanabaena sp. 'Roaring Creek' TaxID=1681830 RepID=UPI0006D81798|nr:hypothetical protein [Pseudanabaena sp. 'Roaring Creek']